MENKRVNEYSNAALVAAILLIIFGFGTGLVNVIFFGFAVILAFLGLMRNKEKVKKIKIKCISALVIVLVAIILWLIGFSGIIGLFLKI